MRKTIILLVCLVVALTFNVYAENVGEVKYSSFDGGSLIDFSLTADIANNIVVKGTYSILDTFIGDYSKFDIMGGYKTKYVDKNNKESTMLFLAGMRKSEDDTGLLLSADIRTEYSEKVFMHDVIEYVSWSDSDVNVLLAKFLLGYKIEENIAIKGGISWLQSEGESEIGPTFGLETSF